MSSDNLKGVYCGPDAKLKGKTAIVMYTTPGLLMAQFDDLSLGPAYTFGWGVYPVSHFGPIYVLSSAEGEYNPASSEETEAIKPELLNKKVSEW